MPWQPVERIHASREARGETMSSLTELLMSRLSGGDVEQLSNRIGADKDATG